MNIYRQIMNNFTLNINLGQVALLVRYFNQSRRRKNVVKREHFGTLGTCGSPPSQAWSLEVSFIPSTRL